MRATAVITASIYLVVAGALAYEIADREIASAYGAAAIAGVAVYAAVTATLSRRAAALAAVIPALIVLDLVLYIRAGAFDCYPGCTAYQRALVIASWPLILAAGAVLLVAAQRSLRRR